LVAEGLLLPGDKLTHKVIKNSKLVTVEITQKGEIQFENGAVFRNPTSAAKFASGAANVNGWRYWKVIRTGRYLSEL
jgi:predicted transcriptional regulator